MSEQTQSTELFPLKEAKRFAPYRSTTGYSTIHRHVFVGVKAIDKRTVKLKAVKHPTGFMTCRQWLNDFVDEMNKPVDAKSNAGDLASVLVAARRKAQAGAYLDSVGV